MMKLEAAAIKLGWIIIKIEVEKNRLKSKKFLIGRILFIPVAWLIKSRS